MLLAAVVAAWFVIAGVAKLLPAQAAGRRAVAVDPAWLLVARRVRGVLEVLGGLAVAAGGAITVLGLRVPFPGLAISLALSALAGWTVAEGFRSPIRPVRLGLAILGFALAVFFAGFRD